MLVVKQVSNSNSGNNLACLLVSYDAGFTGL